MRELVVGQEADARSARAHALAVLRIRGTALGAALLPAAVAVVLAVGAGTGRIGPGWDGVRWAVTALAVLVLVPAVAVAAVVVRARPAVSPTVAIEERDAPDLYSLVRDLADRLGVPAPSAIALTPDCDSWLEDRTHPAQQTERHAHRTHDTGGRSAPVLVIGSPFLWWMRIAELRALLAPVVAGTGPSAHPDIAAARRFVRGLDAAVAVGERAAPPLRPVLGLVGRAARQLLRSAGPHAAEMERGVAAAASARAHGVDHGLRAVAQEQVGLAYAGWDRLLTRVALPAWRIGRWPARLDAGVVSALTELSRRDRLAEGFASRLGERPACDLLEEPGEMDASVSLLAARVCLGTEDFGPDWSPVDWSAYPEEVVDRIWRMEAARLFEALDATEETAQDTSVRGPSPAPEAAFAPEAAYVPDTAHDSDAEESGPPGDADGLCGPTLARVMERLTGDGGRTDALAARISSAAARDEARGPVPTATGAPAGSPYIPGGDAPAMGLPLQPPRTGRELMADHITAAVCCAAVDTAGAAPGLDWLDGPALLLGGERKAELTRPVLDLVEDGDAQPLRDWLAEVGVRADKPVRLV
ncbi:hypothetical protein [Streptomyces sp. ODS28]|uniref:hypothetical protein n=1 Tax=Streptomyces sp. ODS28 TaxID=3136688 RepID=UPI0031E7E770